MNIKKIKLQSEVEKIQEIIFKMYEAGDTENCFYCNGWGWKKLSDDDLEIENFFLCEICYQTGQVERYPEFGETNW